MKDFKILLLFIFFFVVQKSPFGIQCLIHDHFVLRFCHVKHMVLQPESAHARQGTSLQDKKFPRYREVHHKTITLSPSEFKWVSKYRPGISFHWPVRCCHALCLFCSSRIPQWGRFKSCSLLMLFLKISDNEFSFQFFSEEATFK